MSNPQDFTLTLEDIREMVDEVAEEASNPNSELSKMLEEMRVASIEAAKFDINLANRFIAIRESFVSLVDYVKSRKELH